MTVSGYLSGRTGPSRPTRRITLILSLSPSSSPVSLFLSLSRATRQFARQVAPHVADRTRRSSTLSRSCVLSSPPGRLTFSRSSPLPPTSRFLRRDLSKLTARHTAKQKRRSLTGVPRSRDAAFLCGGDSGGGGGGRDIDSCHSRRSIRRGPPARTVRPFPRNPGFGEMHEVDGTSFSLRSPSLFSIFHLFLSLSFHLSLSHTPSENDARDSTRLLGVLSSSSSIVLPHRRRRGPPSTVSADKPTKYVSPDGCDA